MSHQDECVLGLTGSNRRKIAPIPEESSPPRIIAALLTPSSTPAHGGKDISPPLTAAHVHGARRTGFSFSFAKRKCCHEVLRAPGQQLKSVCCPGCGANTIEASAPCPTRAKLLRQHHHGFIDSRHLPAWRPHSMVSEGPLATDASFARKAFDCDMSEDMLGAHSVSLMASTPSVTHKNNWLQ
jgi:hypothetical protein